MKKFFAVALVAIVAVGTYFCFFAKSDEEKITDTLKKFETAYEQGNLEKCLSCFDTKSRNGLKSAYSLGNTIAGKFGFGLGSNSMSDLFGLSVATQNPKLHYDVKKIEFADSKHATVTAVISLSGIYGSKDESEEASFEMVKEGRNWYMAEDISLF